MARCWWLPLLCAALSCTGGRVVAPAELDLGEVSALRAGSRTLQVRNEGSAAVSFALRVEDGADFSVSPATAALEPGNGGFLTVTFSPRRLGPQRGTLVLSGPGSEVRVALRGTGVGAQLGVSHEVLNLGRLPLVAGIAPDSFAAGLTLSNTGTRGTALQLLTPLVDSAEVCAGALAAGRCVPWVAPAPLSQGERVVLPLMLTPTQPGQRSGAERRRASRGERAGPAGVEL